MSTQSDQTLPPPGPYLITPQGLTAAELTARVADALSAGAVMLQFRDKDPVSAERTRRAEALGRLCRDHQVPLIINDDPGLAARVGAFGVHLGQSDPAAEHTRDAFPDLMIGVSCYNRIGRARELAPVADYLAFGSFFPSRTKPGAVRATTGLLVEARPLGRPLVAIGGVDAGNGGPLVRSGARWLAVCGAVFEQRDIAAACARLRDLFD